MSNATWLRLNGFALHMTWMIDGLSRAPQTRARSNARPSLDRHTTAASMRSSPPQQHCPPNRATRLSNAPSLSPPSATSCARVPASISVGRREAPSARTTNSRPHPAHYLNPYEQLRMAHASLARPSRRLWPSFLRSAGDFAGFFCFWRRGAWGVV